MTSDRLAVLSQRMATVTLWFMGAILLVNAACWIEPSLTSVDGKGLSFSLTNDLISGLGVDISAYPWWQRLGGILLSSIPLLPLIFGLSHLRALFRTYAHCDYFSITAAQHLGRVGQFIALWVLLTFLCEPLLSLWMTLREPAGHHVISVSFTTSDIVALFLAGCISIIARILARASKVHAENKQFV